MFVRNKAFHRSQNLIFIATADSQTFYEMFIFYRETFYEMFIFYRETHYLQTCKHDVRITSPVAVNI